MNRRWRALTGLTAAASLEDGWLNAVHSDDWMAARQFVEDVGRARSIAEWRLVGVDERSVVWVQATSAEVRDHGDGTYVVASPRSTFGHTCGDHLL